MLPHAKWLVDSMLSLLHRVLNWPCMTMKLTAYLCECPGQDFFSKWGQEGTIEFAKTFSELIILTASRTLMGRRSSPTAAEDHPMPCSHSSLVGAFTLSLVQADWTHCDSAFTSTR